MKKKVLAVDDSKTMREMVSFTLSKAGFDVLEAEDGVHALSVAHNQKLDLVITDVNMPNMDGLELVRRLRSDENYKFIPILVLTTEGDGSKKLEGKEAGATGWIVKPFNPDKLIQVVNKICL